MQNNITINKLLLLTFRMKLAMQTEEARISSYVECIPLFFVLSEVMAKTKFNIMYRVCHWV
jgi:hypothetical protein